MNTKKHESLSAAYDVLARYGVDARGVDSQEELVRRFQAVREQYKNGAGGRAAVYEKVIRPAFVTVANAIKNVHPRLHRDESTRIG